jgi:V/A-type H+/Na+-transporting ATPase subunit C
MFSLDYPDTIRVAFYPYTYVRVMAMKGKLYRRQDYDKLLKMQAGEIAKYLEESDYKEDVNILGKEMGGYVLVESAIYANFVRRIRKLQRICSPEMNYLIQAYVKRYDVYNLKTILRAKAAGQNKEAVAHLLLPLGLWDNEKFLHLLDADDLASVLRAVGFKEKSYSYALDYYNKEGSLLELENFVDKAYYTFLFGFIQRLSGKHALFKGFLQLHIDVLNLQLFLRLKKCGLDTERLQGFFFAGGKFFTLSRLQHFAKLDFDAIIEALQHTPLRRVMDQHVEDLKKHNFKLFETALDVWLLQQSTLLLHQFPLSVDTLLGYLFAKEVEVRNLRVIVKGKQLGLEEDFIAQQLVIDK